MLINATISRRLAAGLCTWCEAPSTDHHRCPACRAKNRSKYNRCLDLRYVEGRCVRCGAIRELGDTRLECAKCREKRKLTAATRPALNKHKLYSKRHREKLKQINRCTRCGAALGGDTRLECADCRLQRKIYDAKRAPGT